MLFSHSTHVKTLHTCKYICIYIVYLEGSRTRSPARTLAAFPRSLTFTRAYRVQLKGLNWSPGGKQSGCHWRTVTGSHWEPGNFEGTRIFFIHTTMIIVAAIIIGDMDATELPRPAWRFLSGCHDSRFNQWQQGNANGGWKPKPAPCGRLRTVVPIPQWVSIGFTCRHERWAISRWR